MVQTIDLKFISSLRCHNRVLSHTNNELHSPYTARMHDRNLEWPLTEFSKLIAYATDVVLG